MRPAARETWTPPTQNATLALSKVLEWAVDARMAGLLEGVFRLGYAVGGSDGLSRKFELLGGYQRLSCISALAAAKSHIAPDRLERLVKSCDKWAEVYGRVSAGSKYAEHRLRVVRDAAAQPEISEFVTTSFDAGYTTGLEDSQQPPEEELQSAAREACASAMRAAQLTGYDAVCGTVSEEVARMPREAREKATTGE